MKIGLRGVVCLAATLQIYARQQPRPTAEDTVALNHTDTQAGETGVIVLFYVFVALTVASIMCSLLVLCLRHFVLKNTDSPESGTSQVTLTDRGQAPSPPADELPQHDSSAKLSDVGFAPDAGEAVQVQQPGGSVAVGIRVKR